MPADDPPLAPSDMLCFALYSTAHAVQAAYRPLLDPLGLTYPQYLALTALMAADGQTVGSLGAAVKLDSNTLTPLLKRMQAQGLVARHRATADERQVQVSLTAAGRALGVRAARVPALFAARTGLDSGALTDLRDILTILRDRLRPAAPGPGAAPPDPPQGRS